MYLFTNKMDFADESAKIIFGSAKNQGKSWEFLYEILCELWVSFIMFIYTLLMKPFCLDVVIILSLYLIICIFVN